MQAIARNWANMTRAQKVARVVLSYFLILGTIPADVRASQTAPLSESENDYAPLAPEEHIVDGNLTRGFAILAYPAEYCVSGVMSFLINQEGTVFDKDFRDRTADVAKAMTEFNSDGTWAPVGSFAQN
jgi:hypothetical protein